MELRSLEIQMSGLSELNAKEGLFVVPEEASKNY
jgi:hypothetical protein